MFTQISFHHASTPGSVIFFVHMFQHQQSHCGNVAGWCSNGVPALCSSQWIVLSAHFYIYVRTYLYCRTLPRRPPILSLYRMPRMTPQVQNTHTLHHICHLWYSDLIIAIYVCSTCLHTYIHMYIRMYRAVVLVVVHGCIQYAPYIRSTVALVLIC